MNPGDDPGLGRPPHSAQPLVGAADAGTLPRRRRAARGGATDDEASFASLRAEGLRLAQALSGQVWTDYNLHDPGVTLLEALCYALTDLVYRAGFPVADHLTAPDADGPDYAALSLHPPHEVFPCRPTSAADFRRLLLDRVPGLDDALLSDGRETAGQGLTLPGLPGLYRLRLKPSQGDLPGGQAALWRLARAAWRAGRNLCEDIDYAVHPVQDLWCSLEIDLELDGPREAADVLADVYDLCARHIAQTEAFHGLDELRSRGLTLEQIYTGPATTQGLMTDAGAVRADTLFVSDLGGQVKQLDGVQQLHRLALRPERGAAVTNALAWRSDTAALRLRVPGVSASALAPAVIAEMLASDVQLRRRGSRVNVLPADLASRMADLSAINRARRQGHLAAQHAPLPTGQHRELQRYRSVQNDFPAVYGLGPEGLPASAGAHRQAQALQLKTYLVLFEQMIAHGAAQLQYLRELFAWQNALQPSYAWQMLDSRHVPGLDALYRLPEGAPALAGDALRAEVQARVYEATDPWADRRSRVLDHLLALHGVTYTQNSMRQFCSYLAPDELERALLRNKAGFLREIVTLLRDRGAGLDYSRPTWGRGDNMSGLQRRLGYLLGFAHRRNRSLTHTLRRHQLTLRPASPRDTADTLAAPVASAPLPPLPAGTRPHWAVAKALAGVSRLLSAGRLDEALLRVAVSAERYRVVDAASGEAPGGDLDALRGAAVRLLLGPDEHQRWWPLGKFARLDDAAQAADALRRFALHLTRGSEGLHVVEHVLLRPVGDSAAHAALRELPDDFYGLRLTVVLPAWTTRCHGDNFRRFAEESVAINSPAHLAPRCLWLGFDAMGRFEQAWARWLTVKRRFSLVTAGLADEAGPDGPDPTALNRAACRVIECLRPVWQINPDILLPDDDA